MPLSTLKIFRNAVVPIALLVALLASAAGAAAQDQAPQPAANASTTAVADGSPSPLTAAEVHDAHALAKASNAFGVDLWKQVATTPGNLAISPASISAALAMTRGGAKGATAKQIHKVMHLGGDADTDGKQWGRLIEELQDPSLPRTLRIANRLFGLNTLSFDQQFLNWTNVVFGAVLEPLPFNDAAEASRAHINAWVEDRTGHRIRDLLPPGSIDAATRLVLINAIYFHADWQQPFEKQATSQAPFHRLSPFPAEDVATMHSGNSFRAAMINDVKVLEVPYKGGDCTMLIVLPNKADGLADVEKTLSAAMIETWLKALAWHQSNVALPRFELDASAPSALGDALRTLGMPLAFNPDKANFTGIAKPLHPKDRLFLGEVFHKAFVKVDEAGTEAAAATAGVMRTTAAPMPVSSEPPFEFRADHPFLFFIIDKSSGLILFMGRVSDPSVGGGA